MTTILCRIEAVLNSCPLTPMSSSSLVLDYLIPGNFLIGQPLLTVFDLTLPEATVKHLTRWMLLRHCHQTFWRRWHTDYLSALQNRTKWKTDLPNIKIGDMVIIKSNQRPPMTWRMGRILKVFPGNDGVVRVARVLKSQGELIRPVVKLVLLPTQ